LHTLIFIAAWDHLTAVYYNKIIRVTMFAHARDK
jgi:hypothetical protein